MKPDNRLIILHSASNLFIEDPTVFIKSKNIQVHVEYSFQYPNNDYLVIKLEKGLAMKTNIIVKIQFQRALDSDEENGFLLKKYIDSDGLTKYQIRIEYK